MGGDESALFEGVVQPFYAAVPGGGGEGVAGAVVEEAQADGFAIEAID
jgi:hypothetical protein